MNTKRDPGPIGVFDSGLGGLTVLSELVRTFPHENFIYLGDSARAPYGSRSPKTIQKYSEEITHYLMKFNIKMLVIACNTATAQAEMHLKSLVSIPVVGVIRPGVKALLSRTHNNRLGVIGTRSTVKSDQYAKLIKEKNPAAYVLSRACPLFVPLVEEGWIESMATHLAVEEYLSPFIREGIDTVVLGCTHYPLLKPAIRRRFPGLDLVDSSVEVAKAVKEILVNEEPVDSAEPGKIRILLTDMTDQTQTIIARMFAGLHYDSIEEIILGD